VAHLVMVEVDEHLGSNDVAIDGRATTVRPVATRIHSSASHPEVR
jgi:hypothetical protein